MAKTLIFPAGSGLISNFPKKEVRKQVKSPILTNLPRIETWIFPFIYSVQNHSNPR
jgi:hypothetical protein